ncbi:MAG: helix-turn-helix transcriptional regulator [Clostridia bacterium]|nr:helix-turn-helix transcriptional regulator [Clostridia bacterium]
MSETNKFAKEIGRRIYAQRKRLGLTQEQIAELADVSPQLLSSAENGIRNISAENLFKISKALNVSSDYLYTGEVTDKDKSIVLEKFADATPEQLNALEEIYDVIKKM